MAYATAAGLAAALLIGIPAARATTWLLDSSASPISAALDDTTGRLSVTVKSTGTVWGQGTAGGGSSWSRNGTAIQADALNVSVPALLNSSPVTVSCQLVPASGELKVTIDSASANIANGLVYPYPFFKPDGSGYAVLPYNGGFVVPTTATTWTQPSSHSRMEWVGGTDGSWNEGWMAIADPADDMQLIKQTSTIGGNSRLGGAFQWLGSNANDSLTPNLLSYSRTTTFTFYASGGYVAQAKHFRDFATTKDWLVTLLAKSLANPDAGKLLGAPVIYLWGDGRSDTMLNALAAAGLQNALIQISINHVDQNNFFPNTAYAGGSGWSAAVRSHGWVPGIYDIYAAYRTGQTTPPLNGFTYLWETGGAGSASTSSTWAYLKSDSATWDIQNGAANIAHGKSAPFARDVRLPAHIAQFGLGAFFFDTTCAVPIPEDYAAAYGHSASRAQDIANRAALLAAASGATAPNHNKLAGTEQAKSWAVPQIAWTEGMFKLGASNSPGGYGSFTNNVYPQILTEVTDPGANLATVLNTGYQVPLWELVYHDALLSTQHWHLAHNKLLYCWDFADLSAMIRGQAPLLNLAYNGDPGSLGFTIAGATDVVTGKFWDTKWTNPNVSARVTQTFNTVCAWQGIVGDLPMIDHKVLSADSSDNYLVQNSEFSGDGGASGYGIVVNVGSYPGTGFAMTGATWSGNLRGTSLSVPVGGYATYSWGGNQAAAPTFSPAAGTYVTTLSVTIASPTAGASIRYTTDGSTPTATTGNLYAAPVSIASSTTLKAIAFKSGLTDSSVATAIYTLNLTPVQVEAPAFSPVGGTYASAQSVTITSATPGASIRYTTDGSTLSATSGTVYSTPVTVGATATLKALAYKSGMADSAVSSASYTIAPAQGQAVAPAFSPAGGTFTAAQSVTISSATPGAAIRYTTDGSTPSGTNGTLYAGPVSIATTAVLRAVASASGMNDSPVTIDTYTIQSGTTTTTLPSVAQEDGWVLESSAGSGTGGSLNASDATANGLRVGDDAANKRYKAIASFNTATLPANASIVSATLLLRRGAVTGALGALGTLSADIATGAFNGSAALEIADFQAAPTAAQVATLSVPGTNGQIVVGALNAAGVAAINRTGRTQFRFAFANATNANASADFLGLYASDNPTPLNWPALQIVYVISSAPVFTSQPAALTVTVGNPATFAAAATGFPTPTYQWFRNGVALPGATASTLALPNVTTAAAGTYSVVASNSVGTATSSAALLTVNPASATVTFAGLHQTYDGAPKTVTTATQPVGLAVSVTYDGSLTPPTAAGSYAVVATINDADYTGTASDTLTLSPASAAVTLGQLDQSFDGTPKTVTVTTTPAGLPLNVTYDGSTIPPKQVGAYAIEAIVTDPNYSGSASGTLNVRDTTPPALTIPANRTVEATGPSGAVVSFNATALDDVSGTVPVDASPASGSTFPLGVTTVQLAATDAAGNTAASTFIVTVLDTIAPAIMTPANVTAEASGAAGAVVTYQATASDLVSGPVAVNCSPASGSAFPLGTTIVQLTATDTADNTAASFFTVTVVDTTAPAIAPPANVTAEATSAAGAVVTYQATASDLVSGAVAVSGSPASGSVFPLGTTTVQLTSTDAAGNTATRSFTVIVRDTTAPTLALPANFTVDGPSILGGVVTYSATATDEVSGSVAVTLSPASGTSLPLGDTIVTATATDAAGNTATGSFTVTVRAPVAALLNRLGSASGTVTGSVRLYGSENVTLNGGASISGELIVTGTPTIRLNGNPGYGGTLAGAGATTPTGYTITLNGGSSVLRTVRRINADTLPTVAQPATPTGTRNVTINNSSQSPGDFATLRDLTLNGGAGTVTVPGGTYGSFTVNGGGGLTLGTAGATTATVYAFQSLTLNGGAVFRAVGPVIVTVKNGFSANTSMGDTAHPDWLELRVASGGLTLNGGVTVAAKVVAPTGTVTLNGGATLTGGLAADRLTLNGGGRLTLSLR